MRITVTYKPQTFTVPARAGVKELLALPVTATKMRELQELLDDLTAANEIPYPAAATVVAATRRRQK